MSVVLAFLCATLASGVIAQGMGAGGSGQAGSDSAASTQSSVMAGSLVAFLQHHPDMFQIAQAEVARTLGEDPTKISQQQVFDQIRQNPGLALRITQAIEKRGYNIEGDMSGVQVNPQNISPLSAPQQTGQPQAVQLSAILVQGTACPAGYVPLPGGTPVSPAGNQGAGGIQSRLSSLAGSGLPGSSSLAGSLGGQGTLSALAASGLATGMNSQTILNALGGMNAPSTMATQGGLSSAAGQANTLPSTQGQQAAPNSFLPPGILICVPSQYNANQPILHQRELPNEYLQSLIELYTQVLPPDDSMLKRFGSDIFTVGSGNLDQLPADLPAGPDYVLGTGDELNINIWGSQSASLSVTIDRQGQVALPEAGTVELSGLTIAAAQKAIQSSLHTQFREMHVELSLGRVRTVRIYVVGDVQRPGAYDVSSLSTPLNALYQAGGPSSTGSIRMLKHYRGLRLVSDIDLYDFLLHGLRTPSERLLPGDTLMIPAVGAQVSVNGAIRRPAIYELKGGESLKDLLDMAGGVLVDASLKTIDVARVDAHARHTMVSVQVPPQSAPGQAATDAPELKGFRIQDGDAVLVHPISPYNQSVVFLDGHVYHPGKYPYSEGMTVNDLLRSNQDLMPEPADRLELIRLVGADRHPESTLLKLEDVLHGNPAMPLKPFDFLRVFSRYEVDPPTVTIAGEVIRPGSYPMPAGMKATDLVRMAGGLRRSAYQAEADLATYTVQEGKRVLIQTRVIDLDKAMHGDATADVSLQPGEILSVRQIGGWQDVGSTVTLSGEVAHAGTYGITYGERLSSVLRRAGGFSESAFPQGIVLQRDSARALADKARQDMIARLQAVDLGSQALSASIGGNTQSQSDVFQMMRAQQQEALAALRATPSSGRVVIKIGRDISRWENTPADIRLAANDSIFIPKLNEIVSVVGQVYDQTSLAYVRGKDVRWYLQQAGGTTRSADRGAIYVIHADGSHISRASGWIANGTLSSRLLPGDTIVVPEKIVGAPFWKSLMESAQAMMAPAALAIAATR